MKKLFTLFFFASASALAQPSFQVNHCFQVGDSNRIAFATILQSLDAVIQNTGTNNTWNFSLQLWQNPKNPYVFQEASKSIHTEFANSEINELGTAVFARDYFYTYSGDKDTLYLDGMYSTTSSKYRPRIPYFSFPMNYGDTTKIYLKQYANPNAPSIATGSVKRSWVYDGYGTVNLGFATISDVYRIHATQTDSLYLAQFDFSTDELIYFRASDGVPILRLVRNGTFISAFYGSAMNATGIENNKADKLMVYPNPGSNLIYVGSSAHGSCAREIVPINRDKLCSCAHNSCARYLIIDMKGSVVQEGILENNSIDISSIERGVYVLKVGSLVGRVVKN